MRNRTIAVLLAAALALAAGGVVAQRGRGGPGLGMSMGMGKSPAGGPCGLGLGVGMGPAAVAELGLTTDQTTQLHKITDQYLADTQEMRADLETKLKELAALWTAETPDESAIRNKMAEVDAIRGRIRNAMVDRTFTVMKVLTPQQKTKLREMVKSRPGFGVGMGYGLGMGSAMDGGNCYMMGGMGAGRGYGGGNAE